MESENIKIDSQLTIDIEFRNLSYNVYSSKKKTKCILKDISGKFISGQFTAIMGPSGGGKTSLLNVLAGFRCAGVTGDILINGERRSTSYIRKCSRYIMQDIFLPNFLTLEESMLVAAHFKLSHKETLEDKWEKIDKLLNQLGLNECRETMVNNLSGGQRRRLMIALELIDDPPILFLDEPTTGLDDTACLRCVDLLKLLAEEGRTVICAIHIPSPKAFSQFDNVYIMSEGQCAYQGYGPSIVPFLEDLGLICPKTYNIPDFMLDVCVREYGDYQFQMVKASGNGKENKYCIQEKKAVEASSASDNYLQVEQLPFFEQFYLLTLGFWKEIFRNKIAFLIQSIAYIFLGIVAGNVFYNVGNDGSQSILNYKFFLHVTSTSSYIAMTVMVIWIPQEYEKLRREHFNQWYGLGAYMVALTIAHLPILFTFIAIYTGIVYYSADQPMNFQSISEFFAVMLLNAFLSESYGILCGALFGMINGIFASVLLYTYALIFCIHGLGQAKYDQPLGIHILLKTAYLRYTLEGVFTSVFKSRPDMACPDEAEWCVLTNGLKVMEGMNFHTENLYLDLIVLGVMAMVYRLLSFYVLYLKLNPHRMPKILVPLTESMSKFLKTYATYS